jgi:hypothetical protein
MLKLLFAVITVPLILYSDPAQAKPAKGPRKGDMTFTSLNVSTVCSDCSVVQVSGVFDETTMKGYQDLLEKKPLKKNVFFVFDSPGGSMRAAMSLGASLRGKKVNTLIGRAVVRNGEVEIEPGRCASSCVLAYLGGATRSISAEARLGVHSWIPYDLINSEEEKEKGKLPVLDQMRFGEIQRATALYLKYLELMGIDLRLATLTLQTPFTEVVWVTPRDRRLWNLVTVDSMLSTPSDRAWPIIFFGESKRPVPSGGKNKRPLPLSDALSPIG